MIKPVYVITLALILVTALAEPVLAVSPANVAEAGLPMAQAASLKTTPVPASGSYIVKAGDTLSQIAYDYGISMTAILSANPGIKPDLIYPGQVIKLPDKAAAQAATPAAPVSASTQVPAASSGSTPYTVVAGDCLSALASRFHTTVAAIKAANRLKSDVIFIDQTLIIPGTAAPAASTSVTASTKPYLSGVTSRAREIFVAGQQRGKHAHVFAVIGDSNSSAPEFLRPFDDGTYSTAAYAGLQDTIAYFKGSFAHNSVAAKPSYSTARQLEPAPADGLCQPGETLLACEYRRKQPAVALILLGTNGRYQWQDFENTYRRVIEYTLQQNIIPVLTTKPDSTEKPDVGENYINDRIRKAAVDYQVPLLDLWLVTRSLPNFGLLDDDIHLSQAGFSIRNQITLEMLDLLRRQVMYDVP